MRALASTLTQEPTYTDLLQQDAKYFRIQARQYPNAVIHLTEGGLITASTISRR